MTCRTAPLVFSANVNHRSVAGRELRALPLGRGARRTLEGKLRLSRSGIGCGQRLVIRALLAPPKFIIRFALNGNEASAGPPDRGRNTRKRSESQSLYFGFKRVRPS